MRETAINWIDEDKEVMVSTSESHIKNKLDKFCEEFPEHYILKSESGEYKNYIIKEKRLIKFSKPRIMTYDEKQKLADRFKGSN